MSNRPIILGIVGDSAAGKTTLTKGIAQVLGEEDVTVICTDDYHRYDRRQRADRLAEQTQRQPDLEAASDHAGQLPQQADSELAAAREQRLQFRVQPPGIAEQCGDPAFLAEHADHRPLEV